MIHAAITNRKFVGGEEFVEGQAFKFNANLTTKWGGISSRFFQLKASEVFDYEVAWHRTPSQARAAAEDEALISEITVEMLTDKIAV
jgi:hypothetical protein